VEPPCCCRCCVDTRCWSDATEAADDDEFCTVYTIVKLSLIKTLIRDAEERTDRHTDRHTHTNRDKEIDRLTDRLA